MVSAAAVAVLVAMAVAFLLIFFALRHSPRTVRQQRQRAAAADGTSASAATELLTSTPNSHVPPSPAYSAALASPFHVATDELIL